MTEATVTSGAPGPAVSNDDPFLVLGIETSCDETAVAVVANGTAVVSSVVSSQTGAAAHGWRPCSTRVVPGICASMSASRRAYSGVSTSWAHITRASSFVST